MESGKIFQRFTLTEEMIRKILSQYRAVAWESVANDGKPGQYLFRSAIHITDGPELLDDGVLVLCGIFSPDDRVAPIEEWWVDEDGYDEGLEPCWKCHWIWRNKIRGIKRNT